MWAGSAFVLAAGLMALITSIVYSHDAKVATNLSATTMAVVTGVAGRDFGYTYGACKGIGTVSPLPKVGSQVKVFYNSNDPCDHLLYDPVARADSNLVWLLAFSVIISLAVGSAGWDAARVRRVRSSMQSAETAG